MSWAGTESLVTRKKFWPRLLGLTMKESTWEMKREEPESLRHPTPEFPTSNSVTQDKTVLSWTNQLYWAFYCIKATSGMGVEGPQVTEHPGWGSCF